MSIRSTDRLFDFMKSRLRKAEAAREDWAAPPDHIFEEAMVELGAQNAAKSKERRRSAFILVSCLVLAGVLIGTGIHLNNLGKKIEDLQDAVLDKDRKELEQALSSVELAETTDSPVEKELFVKPGKRSAGVSGGVASPRRSVNSAAFTAGKTIRDGSSGSSMKIVDQQIGSETTTGVETPHGAPGTTDQIASEGIGIVGEEGSAREVDMVLHLHRLDAELIKPYSLLPTMQPEIAPGKTSRWALGLMSTTNASTFSMKNVADGMPLLTEYDKYYWGLGAAASIEYRIKPRWLATGDLAYSHVLNRSHIVDQHEYNSSNESYDGAGNPMYLSKIGVPTPLGDHQGDMAFYMDGRELRDGMMLDKKGDVEQSLNIWSLSLGSKYVPVMRERFELMVGAGFTATRISGVRNDSSTDIYYEGEFITSVKSNAINTDELAGLFGSFYGEAEIRFMLTDRIDLAMGVRYSRSVTSLRKAHEGIPKTYLGQVRPQLGIIYKLRKSGKQVSNIE